MLAFSFSFSNRRATKQTTCKIKTTQDYTFKNICANNLKVAATNISSFIFAGIPAIISLFQNGLVLGYYTSTSIHQAKIPRIKVLMLILPHAVFEFFGLILSVVIPFEIGLRIFKSFSRPFESNDVKNLFIYATILSLISFFSIIIGAWLEIEIALKLI